MDQLEVRMGSIPTEEIMDEVVRRFVDVADASSSEVYIRRFLESIASEVSVLSLKNGTSIDT